VTDNTSDTPWWDLFFRGSWSEISATLKPAEATDQESEFILDTLRLKPGSRVLDVPCGTGRLGHALAGAGHSVVGVDLQPGLVESANQSARERSLDFEAHVTDIRDLPWSGDFDAAICFWSSLGYLEDGGDTRFLEAVWNTLKPGAPFLVDTQSIETALPGFLEKDWYQAGDWLVLEERQFDPRTSRIHGEWAFVRDGIVDKRRMSIRMYTCRELSALLESCGFEIAGTFDTLTGELFELGASHLAVLARKT